MSLLRRSLPALVLASLCIALSAGVPSAVASDPFPVYAVASLSSTHFTVYWDRNNVDQFCPKAYITQEQAGDVLGMLERAYSLYSSWGYAPPASPMNVSIDDFQEAPPCVSNGTIDVTVPRDSAGSLKRWTGLVNPSDGELHLDASTGLTYHTVAHEIFHLFENAINPALDQWLQEGTAEWAAFRAESFLTPTKSDLGQNPDRTADCVGAECGDTELDRNGYPGWVLFEYLSERFGTDAVKSVLTDPGSPGTTALSNVLVSKGTTLASFFNDYTTAKLTGNFALDAINGLLPAYYAKVATGDLNGPLPTTNVAVNHLAVRYVALQHGAAGDTGREPCYAATLTLDVAIPSGVTSTPYYYANTSGATAQALAVSGSNAAISVPWNTCATSPDGYLSLPNDSLGMDGREFVITGEVTVDLSSPAAPTIPQPGAIIVGPVIEAPTTDPPPDLTVYAPELLRVNARTRVLRFVIYSSGSGSVDAVLGSTDLGSASVRAGNNDVRWKLPLSLVTALRKTNADNLLSLTSLSPSGEPGETLTRRVAIVANKKKSRR
jgi:hypothetical protein